MSTESQAGDVRFSDAGEIEVFDGTEWGPYRRLSPDGDIVYRYGIDGEPDE
jgi:hypothetical protein